VANRASKRLSQALLPRLKKLNRNAQAVAAAQRQSCSKVEKEDSDRADLRSCEGELLRVSGMARGTT
jgi:predicted phage gp36 major capsid-like protein